MRNGNHDTTNGNVMIFRYFGNGERINGEGMND